MNPLAVRPLPTRILLLTLAMLWLSLGRYAAGQVDDKAPQYEQLRQRLSQIIQYEIEQKDIPSFSIAVVADGKTLFSDGFGFQDQEKTQPATGKTVYRVGSISKLLTDVALMQLVQEGTVDMDQPVVDIIPAFSIGDAEATNRITLRQLTQHRAGIVREPPQGHYFDPDEPSLQQTVDSLAKTPLIYEVGTHTKYSNAGVSVVGLAVEQASKQSHPEYVQEKILSPLQMQQTSFLLDEVASQDLATGWMWGYDRPNWPAPDFMLGTGPAGNLYSSVEDLAKFSRFVMGDHPTEILKPEFLSEMTSPGKDQAGNDLPYGIGFRIGNLDGMTKIGHGGAVYGFSTQLEIIPQEHIAVAAASSKDGTNALVTRICDFALRSLVAIGVVEQKLPIERTVASKEVSTAQEDSAHGQSSR